ncbi:MAG: DUF721 domain-containing protein [Victivallaceae bacterium]
MSRFFSKDNNSLKRAKRSLTATTTTSLKDVLFEAEIRFKKMKRESSLEVMEAWDLIINEKFKNMSRAIGFIDSVLKVVVYNSSFYSSLKQFNQKILMERLRARVPRTTVTRIEFFLG